MRLFYHISEFRLAGMQYLPTAMFVSERLRLWSPSSGLIRAAFEEEYSYVRPEDILEWIQNRKLQVIGRKEWLTDPTSRERSDFPYAAWDDNFDAKIAAMGFADDDAHVPQVDRRVVFAEREKGYDWADKVLASTTKKDLARVDSAERILADRSLPAAALEKVDNLSDSRERLRIVLRDAFNHEFAVSESDSTMPIADQHAINFVTQLVGNELRKKWTLPEAVPAPDRLFEVIKYLSLIDRPKSAKKLQSLLDNSEDVRAEVGKIAASDFPVDQAIAAMIRNGHSEPSWLKALLPHEPKSLVTTLLGAVVGVSQLAMGLPPFGLIGVLAGPTVGTIQLKTDWLSAPDYTGPVLPFVLACETANPSYRQISSLRDSLPRLHVTT